MGAAIHSNARKVIRYLLDQGVELDIFTACALGKYELVEKFLDKEPILIRSHAKHAHKLDLMDLAPTKKMESLLLARGFPMSVHLAAGKGMLDQVKRYLKESPEQLEAKDSGGATPIFSAIWGGQDDVAFYLLDQGAKYDSGKESRPLSFACVWGRHKVAEALLQKGVDISFLSFNYPYSYLHCCSNWGNEGMGDLNPATYSEAILKIIRLLFKHGIDPNIKDGKGTTAHQQCLNNGYTDRAELIQSLS